MRIMALDFGSKTVGVAMTDPLLVTIRPVEIIRRKHEDKLRRTLARIEELIVQYEVSGLVLGYPKNMDGTEGERCEKTLAFKEHIERRTGFTVALCDERLTTVEAEEIMEEEGIRREDYKDHVDSYAACVILRDYLNNRTTPDS